jgi:hypothetical protein
MSAALGTPLRRHLLEAVQDWWADVSPFPMWPLVWRKDAEEAEQQSFQLGQRHERFEQREAAYKCPSWCTRTDHEADYVDNIYALPIHYGPDFGPVSVQATGLDAPHVVVSFGDETVSLELRDARALANGLASAVRYCDRP